MKKDLHQQNSVVSVNRKARFNYSIEKTYEAGLVLEGCEVKSFRGHKVQLQQAFVAPYKKGLALMQMFVAPFEQAHHASDAPYNPYRPRLLLLSGREIKTLRGKLQEKGTVLVPLSIYFTHKGWIKVELGLGTGKKMHDKRQAIKEKEWQRSKQRVVKYGTLNRTR